MPLRVTVSAALAIDEDELDTELDLDEILDTDDASVLKALEALEKAIAQLPSDLKSALILFALEDQSQQECAEILGVSSKTVETRVYRARKLLKNTLRRFQ